MNRQSFFSPLAFGLSLALLTAAIPAKADDLDQVIEHKLDTIIIPSVNFTNVPLRRVLETLTELSKQHDPSEEGPPGVGITTLLDPENHPEVTIATRNVRLRLILAFISDSTGYNYAIRQGAVEFYPDDNRFFLSFPGGTIKRFIDRVTEDSGQDINVYIDPEAEDLFFPPLTLRSVTLGNVAALARQIAARHEGLRWTTIQPGIWSITLHRQQAPSEPETLHTSVFHLGTLTDHFSFDDIATALQIAVEMEDARDVSIRIHEETGLLFFRGPKEASQTAESVISRLLVQETFLRHADQNRPPSPAIEDD